LGRRARSVKRSGGICCSRACCCSRPRRWWRTGRPPERNFYDLRVGVAPVAGAKLSTGRADMEHRAELVEIIRRVRNRWRVKLALRGAVIVLAGIVLTLFLSASSLE